MCPLRWLWIRLPGTRQFVALHYTHERSASQFEIFISWIRFSDASFSFGSAIVGMFF
jgi:hypothetical protein